MPDVDFRVASADRRPVDPPPVVELKVYEGAGEARKDITFSYHANFFLYITLENARPIAQGRMPNSQTTIPVLTGTPVAGMAYLDRPTPAGYFIFPDLSVRHEGKYRLSFNLYEEPKDAKDADAESGPGSQQSMKVMAPNGAKAMSPQSHIHFRLEVKSEPFQVFSAKKFPGLKESTNISRIVSEQGCRVRIRRDVRMRRRDPKSKGVYDDYQDESVFAHLDRYSTPEIYKPQIPERPLSMGKSAPQFPNINYGVPQQPNVPYGAPPTQNVGYGGPPSQNVSYGPPQPQPVSSGAGNHLAFGDQSIPSNPPFPDIYGYSGANGYLAGSSSNFNGMMTPTTQMPTSLPPRTGKRRHDTVFDTSHMGEPLRGGMRPNLGSLGQDVPQIEAEDGSYEDLDVRADMKLLLYRRADGRQQARKCPSPVSE